MKQQLLDLIGRAYQEKHAFMDSLSSEQGEMMGVSGEWAPKDYVVHMIVWEEHLIDNHQAALQGVTPPSYDDFEQENDVIFQAHRAMTLDEIRRKVDAIHEKLIAWVQAQSEDDLTDPARFPWLNNRALWGRIVGNCVLHPLLHLAELHAKQGQRDYGTQMQESIVPPLLALSDAPAWQSATRYNLACCYSLVGLKEKAIAKLGEAFKIDSGLIEWSKQDPDLNALRDDPAYQALYTQSPD